ncbi:hypothetical protein [Mucilaginibacter xinganensis]|uniref:Uncharacterized protein n=1 Tax=Mucilaginibacter xinganensis TaxID=1234841 RepID=A0A223NTK3_9SPHI|nr:hypothetical protein [Mucilaginibacter xinganensis]ASU32978.1 hypothetical protein MuYL_1078 [Mucilaginibacter xinganensis]
MNFSLIIPINNYLVFALKTKVNLLKSSTLKTKRIGDLYWVLKDTYLFKKKEYFFGAGKKSGKYRTKNGPWTTI